MGLKCHNCGSTDTITVKKSNLEKVHGNVNSRGVIDKDIIREVIKLISIVIAILIPFLTNKFDPLYVVCKQCGSYKKVD